MNEEQVYFRTNLLIKCPHCNDKIVIGVATSYPITEYALKLEDIKKKKDILIDAIKTSSLSEDQKETLIKTYGEDDVIISPSDADMLINEIKTRYAKI